MNNLLMLGAQGSGKGTQAERLAFKLGIPTVSVGHLFRAEIDKHTGLGEGIEGYIDKGERVPDGIVNQLMHGRLGEDDVAHGVILDGYPRTFDQLASLDQLFGGLGREITGVIYLNVSDAVALERLSGRWVCSNTKCEENYHERFNPPKGEPGKCDRCGSALIQRDDDRPEAIKRRLELYHQDTQPLIDHYRKRGILVEVNGDQPIEKVEADIAAAMAQR
jgi:adenylate kinase